MKSLMQELQDVVSTLFQRYPSLCGFSVSQDLAFAHVACHPALMGADAQLLCEDICAMLREILEDRPEAAEFLRGRTVARTLQ